MASKLAIAIARQDALARLEAAMDSLAEKLGLERPDIPKNGRDDALLQSQQLDAIATWAEGVVSAVPSNKKG